MIDHHCHLLPGFDDGPATLEVALVMARGLADFGFSVVHCTPHCIAGHYEFSPMEVRAAVAALQGELDKAGIPLRLRAGMEYYLDEHFARFAANLLPLGESRLVLCEAPPMAIPEVVAEQLGRIVAAGWLPLVAHPERTEPVWRMLEAQHRAAFEEEADDLDDANGAAEEVAPPRRSFWQRWFLPAAGTPRPAGTLSVPVPGFPPGTHFQGNLGSFAGFYGPLPQRRAYELLQRGVYHCLASDLHDPYFIPNCLEPAAVRLEANPALRRLADFIAPGGEAGEGQVAFR